MAITSLARWATEATASLASTVMVRFVIAGSARERDGGRADVPLGKARAARRRVNCADPRFLRGAIHSPEAQELRRPGGSPQCTSLRPTSRRRGCAETPIEGIPRPLRTIVVRERALKGKDRWHSLFILHDDATPPLDLLHEYRTRQQAWS